ncbi:syntaxin-binding protein 4 isoform X1 [Scyliorhinus canicula]|uniref:syntaxin-binding protein 4 isoform X1 n=1 Tax=Scyliorhinus canicula TaxID=7830 RepID=UPI0018F6FFDE|nr:syntaxin-binding protein 4 isoform X1 [Scyliorhinus canicula]
MPTFSVLYKGAVIISRTLLGPYGIDRRVLCVDFTDCENGLGIKVIGGVKELSGEEYGVYVKRILPGGLASVDGRLQPGDQILEVNGDSLVGVTNESAVEILRAASSSNNMRLMIARDEQGRREFSELLANYGSRSSTGSARNSPTLQGTGRTSSSSSSSSLSSEQFSPTSSRKASIGKAGTLLCSNTHDDGIQLVTITKSVGLGVTVTGGCNRPDGPKVYVEDIISGGDCQKDGRLHPGDELVAINKKSLIGVTYEEARSILNKTMFTNEGTITIAFLPGKGSVHSGASLHNGENSSQRNTGNGYSSCRLKVHVRTPKPQLEDHCPVPFPPPDIFPVELSASETHKVPSSKPMDMLSRVFKEVICIEMNECVARQSRLRCVTAAKTSIQKEVPTIKRKVSLDPHVRLKVDKLELALKYLGLHVTEERRRMLRRSLTNDSQGTVAFGEFVQAARITLPQELEDIGLSQSPMMFFPHEVANLLDTTAFQSQIFSSNPFHEAENLDHLQSEVTELHQEIKKMKALVKEMEKNKKTQEEEFQQVTQKATAALAENRTLQAKLHLASAAQHRAHSAEQDYEEVVRLLEAEITDLKTELAGKTQSNSEELTKEDTRDVRQRLSIASCQLQTSELRCKHLEISNQKLFSFAEKVHKVLTSATLQGPDQGAIKSKFFRRESSLPSPGPERLLATEARQLIEWVCSSNSENATCVKTDGEASQEPTAQSRKASRDKNPPTHSHINSQLQEILFI